MYAQISIFDPAMFIKMMASTQNALIVSIKPKFKEKQTKQRFFYKFKTCANTFRCDLNFFVDGDLFVTLSPIVVVKPVVQT